MARTSILAHLTIGLLVTTAALAQNADAAKKPDDKADDAAKKATSQPADKEAVGEPIVFEVIQIQGVARVGSAPIDLEAMDDWATLKIRDRLRAGDVISTGLRSRVKVAAIPAEPPTVMMFEGGSIIKIEEAASLHGIAKARLALKHGAIRAGVAEGQVRSEMEISCPVATLSKRGTDIFRMEYGNGRFSVSLSPKGRGLLKAMQLEWNSKGQIRRMRSRYVTAGQFVTHRMAMAVDQVNLSRNINVNDLFGLIGNDQVFTLLNDRGIGFLLPQGSNVANYLGGPPRINQVGVLGGVGSDPESLTLPRSRSALHQSAGDFGVGQGSLPAFINSITRSASKRQKLRDIVRKQTERKSLERSRK